MYGTCRPVAIKNSRRHEQWRRLVRAVVRGTIIYVDHTAIDVLRKLEYCSHQGGLLGDVMFPHFNSKQPVYSEYTL